MNADAQHTPPMDLPEPMDLGDVLDYQDYREACKVYIRERTNAVARYEQQAKVAAQAESDYQKMKAVQLTNLRTTMGATEAVAVLKGDDKVAAKLIERDTQREVLRARREDIAGIDEASAHLRKVAEWSQRERGVNADQRSPLRSAA